MSILAGILKFDRTASVTSDELATLAVQAVGPNGSDAQGQVVTGNIGMAHRAFWTTPEAHWEDQPLHKQGVILAWDGRLDNRDELIAHLARVEEPSRITDADIVLGLYSRMGTTSFALFIGDWALALWDARLKVLCLARDYIGGRKLYYRLEHDKVVWSTSLEALVSSAGRSLSLNRDYLTQHLLQVPPPDQTPFREIRSVGPAELCAFSIDGSEARTRYWTLDPESEIRYQSGLQYDEHFLDLLRTAIGSRLRSDRAVVSELSGGLDSSAIVCVADQILKTSGRSLELLKTLSYFQTVDEAADERYFFQLIERYRGQAGIHLCLDDTLELAKTHPYFTDDLTGFTALPGKVQQSIAREATRALALQSCDARVVLSGLGGDEFLGGVQYEAPQLAEYLIACRLLSFGKALAAWSTRRRKTYYQLVCESFELLLHGFAPHYSARTPVPGWLLNNPHSHKRSMANFAQWRKLRPTILSAELGRYMISCQFSVAPSRTVGCEEVRWPYLDRRVYVFLSSIPREQVLSPNQRRVLMRRALRDIVPDEILARRTKAHSARLMTSSLQEHASEILESLKAGWVTHELFDTSLLAERVAKVKDGIVDESMLIRRAVGLEVWLRNVMALGYAHL